MRDLKVRGVSARCPCCWIRYIAICGPGDSQTQAAAFLVLQRTYLAPESLCWNF